MIANISERSGGKPLFVSGATGRHGGTGHVIVRELLKKGARVRALARVDDERAASLRAAGADVVIGDLHDHRILRAFPRAAPSPARSSVNPWARVS